MKKNKRIHELISFKLADKLFAIDIDALVEVLEPVVVSPLPLVPAFIDGLVNINGQILPQLDLFKFLYADLTAATESLLPTLLVVKVAGSAFALKVNALQEPISLSEEFWQAVDEADDKPPAANDYLVDITYKEQPLTIFNVAVIADLVRSQAEGDESLAPGFLGERSDNVTQELKLQEFLIVKLAGYEYALALDSVIDVVDVQRVKRLPHSPEILLGVALVRDLPRLVLSLANLLEVADSEAAGLTDLSIVMIGVHGIICGLQVDEIMGLELLAESQLCRNDDGDLLSLIRGVDHSVTEVAHISQLLDNDVLDELKPFFPELKDQQEERIRYVDLLCFSIDGDRYALAIADIKRIVYNKKVQALLEPHPLLLGTFEFDGMVIPVLDVVAQLGYPAALDASDALFNEFVIVSMAGNYWALALGSSDQIISVPEKSIDAVSSAAANFVVAFSRVDEQLLTVLSVAAICKDSRIKQVRTAQELA